MNDYQGLKEYRDRRLIVRGFCAAAAAIRNEYREWIEAELKASTYRLQAFEATAEGEMGREIHQALVDLKEIERTTLWDAIRFVDERIREVEEGPFEDAMEDYRQLLDAIGRFEQIFRSLKRTRRFMDDFS